MYPFPDPVRRGDALVYTGVVYAELPGYRPHLLDLHLPAARPGPVPCVVWLHGGAWLTGDRRFLPWKADLFAACVAAGLAVAAVDYRLSGEALFPAQLHDVKAAIRYLRLNAETLGLAQERFAVWGESAGGHLAAFAGLTGDLPAFGAGDQSTAVRAVVDWYGVADLTAFPDDPAAAASGPSPGSRLIGADVRERPDLAAAASPLTHVRPGAPPFLLVHGDADSEVPHEQSVALADALRAAGNDVRLELVPGARHVFADLDVAPLMDDAVAFLRHHLADS